jgi:carbamoyl-phosphate synthase large subunit
MNNYYVSSIGGDISQSIISIIRNSFPRAVIFGSDRDNQNSGFEEVDKFEISPDASSLDYMVWLKSFLLRNEIDAFIPINERELETLATLSDSQLDKLLGRTTIVWSGSESVRLFGSKLATSNFLTGVGVNVPRVFDGSFDISDSDFPVVVKPEKGAGSRNIFICNTRKEVDAAQVILPNCIIQKYIGDPGKEFTAGVFRGDSGETRVIVFQRKLSGGATGWAKVVSSSELESMCARVAEAINLKGAINIQFRMVGDEPCVFEINGRFSSTIMMRHLLGFNDLLWSLGVMSGFDEFTSRGVEGFIGYKMNAFFVRNN